MKGRVPANRRLARVVVRLAAAWFVVTGVLAGVAWTSATFVLNHSPLPGLVAQRVDAALEAALGEGYQAVVAKPYFTSPRRLIIPEIRLSTEQGMQVARGNRVALAFQWKTVLQALVARADATPAIDRLAVGELALDVGTLPAGEWGRPGENGRQSRGPDDRWRAGGSGDLLAGLDWTKVRERVQALPGLVEIHKLRLDKAGRPLLTVSRVELTAKTSGLILSFQVNPAVAAVGVPVLDGLTRWRANVSWPGGSTVPRVEIEGSLVRGGTLLVAGKLVPIDSGVLAAVWPGGRAIDAGVTSAGATAGPGTSVGRGAGGVRITQLRLTSGDSSVVAKGDILPGEGARGGRDWRYPRLNLQVRAQRVRFPEQLPFLAAYGVSGTASLSDGHLTGRWPDPVLTGRVFSEGGTLFGRGFRRLEGDIQVDRYSFLFRNTILLGKATVAIGSSHYRLNGRFVYPRPAAGRRGQLEIIMETQQGRIEEWGPVFVPSLSELKGPVAGRLEVSGLLGDLGVRGDLVVAGGTYRNVPFDRLDARFFWRGGRLRLEQGRVQVAGARVDLQGEVRPSGLMTMEVAGKGVPLELLWAAGVPGTSGPAGFSDSSRSGDFYGRLAQLVREARDGWLADRALVAGEAEFHGELGGTTAAPALRANVRSGGVRIGRFWFDSAAGQVSWDGRDFTIPLLALKRENGGMYQMTGQVKELALGTPQLDLQVRVSGEPVDQLLELVAGGGGHVNGSGKSGRGGPGAGLEVRLSELALVNGWVYGEARVSGTLAEPSARASLTVAQGRILGRALDVALSLRVVEGKVRVERVRWSAAG
ncbi:MAG TPA: hypothetical protein GXX55_08785 [Firmicutes bacterium]|nr:hypothetical protein [Bacillota bacterium]